MVERDVPVILGRKKVFTQEIGRNLRTTNPCPLQCKSELQGGASFVLRNVGTGPCKKHGASCCSPAGPSSVSVLNPLGRCHVISLNKTREKNGGVGHLWGYSLGTRNYGD